jgi:PEP-CTERM motif
MTRQILYFSALLLILSLSNPAAAQPILEWSDIDYFEGNYSRIYFDYLNPLSTSPGTFYCINDWLTNRDDGGENGGLNPDEYNLFTFTLGTNDFDIFIYGDGSAEIYRDDILANDALENFQSAFSWTTSPNDPTVDHTIWEWSFDVEPSVLRSFAEYDPAGGGWTAYVTPDAPSVITSGPSIYQHFTDGEFADEQMNGVFAPDPSRAYQDPIGDPWLLPGFDIELMEGGGMRAAHIPEPSTLILLGFGLLGTFGIARSRRHNKSANTES